MSNHQRYGFIVNDFLSYYFWESMNPVMDYKLTNIQTFYIHVISKKKNLMTCVYLNMRLFQWKDLNHKGTLTIFLPVYNVMFLSTDRTLKVKRKDLKMWTLWFLALVINFVVTKFSEKKENILCQGSLLCHVIVKFSSTQGN